MLLFFDYQGREKCAKWQHTGRKKCSLYNCIGQKKCELEAESILEGNDIFIEFKGALSEQYVIYK